MSKKKKRVLIVIAVIVILLAVLFLAFSYFLGVQIVASSTQLVTNEGTKDVHEALWVEYGLDYEEFSQSYTIEKMELISSLS